MLEKQIAHARDMVERLQSQRAEDPQATGVPNAELSAWYAGVYERLAEEYGEESSEFKAFRRVNQGALDFKNSWNRKVSAGEIADKHFVGGAVGYLQTMIGHLLTLKDELPSTDVTLHWLFKNVPVKIWASAAGVVATAFVLGLQASRVSWIRMLSGLP